MRYRIGRFRLQSDGSRSDGRANNLRTGCSVPKTGIYQVQHPQHRLPDEVTLIANQAFPRCSKCSEPVCFGLVRSAPAVETSPTSFSVNLYELPEFAEDESLAG